MNGSIFYASIRSFFVSLFTVAGICIGVMAVMVLIAAMSDYSDTSVESNFDMEIVPNAKNVRKAMSNEAPAVLVINFTGTIGLENLSQKNIESLLVESREGSLKANRVKAIFLHIATPGGAAIDSDGIYRALKAYKEQYKVPIYAFVDGICASGGMYIACAADKIYATDTSLVGSIGVIASPFLNVSKMLETIGVQGLTIYAGKGKDNLDPFRTWKPDESERMQELINHFYGQFVDIIVQNRPAVDKEKLVSEYGAHIFPAQKAEEIGYIDGVGQSRNEVMVMLLKQIGIEDDYYQVVELKPNSWLESLFKVEPSALWKGKVVHELRIPGEIPQELMGQFLYLYRN